MTQTTYPLDTSGSLPTNYVSGEEHLVSPNILSSFGLIFPKAGPIYGTNVSVAYTPGGGGATRPLVLGTDYELTLQMVGFGSTPDKQVWGAFSLLNIALNGTVTVSYQALGGNWTYDTAQIANYLNTNPFDANIQYVVLTPSPAIHIPASALTPFPLNSVTAVQQAQSYLGSVSLGVTYYPIGSISPDVDQVNQGKSQLVVILNQLVQLLSTSTTPAGTNHIGSVNIDNWPSPLSVQVINQALGTNAAQEGGGNLAAIAAGIGTPGDTAWDGNSGSSLISAIKAITAKLSTAAKETGGNLDTITANTASAFAPTASSGAGAISNAAQDVVLLAANTGRKFIQFQNTSAGVIYFNPVGVAYNGTSYVGFPIPAGGGVFYDIKVPNTAIHIASSTAGATYFLVEG